VQAFALLDARHNGDIHVPRHPVDIGPDEASYQQTLALADALGMRPLQAQCHRRLGTLYGRWDEHSRRVPPWAQPSISIGLWR
jgi:hypothetical protein